MVRRYISVVSIRSFMCAFPKPSVSAESTGADAPAGADITASQCDTRRGCRGGYHRGGLAGVGAQPFGPLTVAQLGHHLALDLADTLTGQSEQLADLVQRAGLAVFEAEPEPDDLLLALVEGGKDVPNVGVQQLGDDGVLGRHGLGVLD